MKKLLAIFLTCVAISLHATDTKLIVRVKAKDAKFIGTSMGGASIMIYDAVSGALLKEGVTRGSTGDTDLIMKQPHARYQSIVTEGTASFETIFDIKQPLKVRVVARHLQTGVEVSSDIWMIPGKHIGGDGLILEMPGFVVEALAPQTHQGLAGDSEIEIKANVVMMCGCTISNDGLWDAKQFDVEAIVMQNDRVIEQVKLVVKDQVNTFEGTVKLDQSGPYTIFITAHDPKTGNTGVDMVAFLVK
ncbi:MAG: hypothetical protein R3345_09375 [Fulvivirga sp.]|nr:hypothetical protein [Fulvivirga sp.]